VKPYAAAKQQPSTCELWHAFARKRWRWGIISFPQRWRIPIIGRDSPKEKDYWLFHVNQNGEKKEFI
jgi:hypothetical protein